MNTLLLIILGLGALHVTGALVVVYAFHKIKKAEGEVECETCEKPYCDDCANRRER